MSLSKIQEENYKYFLSRLEKLLDDIAYQNKYVVIYDNRIQKVQDSFEEAFRYAVSNFPRKEFIIQRVISPKSINNFLSPAN